MGSWQMVLWQPRFLHAETGALCYQKITADEVCVCLRASWLLSLTRRAHLHRGVCVCAALALPLVSQRPIGRVKRIEFKDVKEIEELEYGEFVLQCSKRDYTFKARMRSHRGSVSCLPTRAPRPRSLPDARSLTLAP